MGTKSQKKAKTRLDAYYRLAKDQGYRSRAAYKLIQLNRKYDFLSKSRSVVDLCAAPGGWCQVAAKFMPMGSKVVGVDLVPIPPIRGVKTFVGDITEDKTRKMVMTYLKKEPVDCVIHDGAGNVGGVWSKDLFAQNALTLASLKFACSVLRAGGWFISKVFRSGDFQKIMWVLKQFFDKVEATKPLASRMESAEIFVVCAGYKAPKTIDPKLFSAQHIFSDVGTEKVMNQSGVLVTPKNNVPQGYEKFNTIESNIATMDEFLRAENPKEFLKAMHEIRFGDEDKKYLKHKSAKKELVYLCQDLQQVGEGDRKKLIRWRDQVLRAFPQAAVGPADDDDVNSAGAVSDYDSEDGVHVMPDEEQLDDEARAAAAAKGTADDAEAIATELLRIRKAHEKEMKRKQKKLIDRKLKQVRGLINHDPYEAARHPTDMGDGDGFEADANDDEMEEGDWAMGSLKKLGEDDMADAFDEMYEEPDEGLNLPINIPMDVNVNEENEMQMGGDEFAEDGRLQIEEGNEEAYDVDAYGNYVVAERAERAAAFDDPMDASSEDEDEEREDPAEKKKRIRRERDEEALDEAGAQAKWQRRHLNIDQVLNRTFPKPRDSKASKKEAAKKARTEEERIQMRAPALPKAGKVDKKKRRAASSDSDSDVVEHPLHDEHGITDSDDDDVGSEFDEMSDFSDDEGAEGQGASYGKSARLGKDQKRVLLPTASFLTTQEKVKQQRKDIDKTNKEKRKARKDKKNLQKEGKKKKKKKGEEGKEDTTFEEIPLAMADPEVRDRTLAMATAMLDKNTRTQMLENGINKFMHNDDDDLPDWFIKDENRNCILQMPITAEEVERQRVRFKEMNARPSKKVAEAVGRKRKKAQRTLRKLLDKGRTDPKSREKTAGLSIRKLMRSKDVRGTPNKKKNQAFDNKNKGEAKRERQRLKKQGGAGKKGGGKKGGRR
jgi:AdoMet-dependent rRNA methyltransferase SPB1